MEKIGYFKDKISGVVLSFKGDYDVKQMKEHPDYIEVTEKEYKDYKSPKQVKE